MRRFVYIAVAMLCVVAASAVAQEVVTVVPAEDTVATDSSLHPLWEILQPFASVILMTIAPVVGGLLIAVLYKLMNFLGIKDADAQKALEMKFRDAAHAAALSAAKYALTKKTGPIGDILSGPIPRDIIDLAMGYVRSKNPDAAAKIGDEDLEEIIISKLPDALATVAASAGTTAATDAAINR